MACIATLWAWIAPPRMNSSGHDPKTGSRGPLIADPRKRLIGAHGLSVSRMIDQSERRAREGMLIERRGEFRPWIKLFFDLSPSTLA